MAAAILTPIFLAAAAGNALGCDAANPQVHQSGQLTWCANATFWSAHAQDVTPFFAFVDRIVPQLSADFNVHSDEQFFVVVRADSGGASTPTPYGPGINVSGDAFYDEAYGIRGFYGYVLVLHEFVNQWTGLAMQGGGWPTDFWANHRSPFPNFVDPILLAELGQPAVASAQKQRFLPGGDTEDPQVPMFTAIHDNLGGWRPYRDYFALLRADGVTWKALRDPPDYVQQTPFVSGNPSPLLAHYVVAYLNLATNVDVRPSFAAAGVGTKPPNWPDDGTFLPYTLDARAIADIATAHCRLLATDAVGRSPTNLGALRRGDYAQVLKNVAAEDANDAVACDGGCTPRAGTCVPTYLVASAVSALPAPADPAPAAAGPSGDAGGSDNAGTAGAPTQTTGTGGGVGGTEEHAPTSGCRAGTGGAPWACLLVLLAGRVRGIAQSSRGAEVARHVFARYMPRVRAAPDPR